MKRNGQANEMTDKDLGANAAADETCQLSQSERLQLPHDAK